MGTLYHYEICCGDSVRLTLQYKTAKLHITIDGLMCIYTKVKQTCMQSVVYCHLNLRVCVGMASWSPSNHTRNLIAKLPYTT